MYQNRDFGVVTLARNPFSDTDDFVCIIAAGMHLMGTAHAIDKLADPTEFKNHPLGGVIRVDMDISHEFAKRFDESSSNWDTPEDEGYSYDDLIDSLEHLQARPVDTSICSIPKDKQAEYFSTCLNFVQSL